MPAAKKWQQTQSANGHEQQHTASKREVLTGSADSEAVAGEVFQCSFTSDIGCRQSEMRMVTNAAHPFETGKRNPALCAMEATNAYIPVRSFAKTVYARTERCVVAQPGRQSS